MNPTRTIGWLAVAGLAACAAIGSDARAASHAPGPVPTTASEPAAPAAATHPAAPAWLAGVRWLGPRAYTADSLRGRVVLVSFWTFECINCRRTIPALQALRAAWPERELLLLGIHTPELAAEYDRDHVARAVQALGVTWPVAQDNDAVAWRAFDNHAWPALYLIDRHGRVRDVHVGELHVGTPAWRELNARIAQLRHEPA